MLYYNRMNDFKARWYSLSAYDQNYIDAQDKRFSSGEKTDHDLNIFLTLRRGKAPSLPTDHNWMAYLRSSGEYAKQQKHKFNRTHGIMSFDNTNENDINIADTLMFNSVSRVPRKDLIEHNAALDIEVSYPRMSDYYNQMYCINLHQLIVTIFGQSDGYCLRMLKNVIKDNDDIQTLVEFLSQCSSYCKDNGYPNLMKLINKSIRNHVLGSKK